MTDRDTTNASSNNEAAGDIHAVDGPNLLRPGNVTLPLAPYLFVSVTGDPDWKIDRMRLHKYLASVASSQDPVAEKRDDWVGFAQKENLMAGDYPLTYPDEWFRGGKWWITASWKSNWEVHLHIGFVNTPGSPHSHIELAVQSGKWLSKLSSKARSWWKTPVVQGGAKIANYETGILLTPRQTFSKTFKSKETASTAVGVALSCLFFLGRHYHESRNLSYAFGIFIASSILIAAATIFVSALFRHFIALPRLKWSIAQLQD